LLIPIGRKYALTPFAETLVGPLREILDRVDSTFELSRKFDPATSQRVFRVSVSDFMIELVMPQVVRTVAALAPGVGIEIFSAVVAGSEMLENGNVEIMLGSEASVSRLLPYEIIKEEEHVIIGWRENKILNDQLTEEQFSSLGRVAARFGPKRTRSVAEAMLHSTGQPQKIELTTSSFVSIPHFIVGTNRIALMHSSLAEAYARVLPLVIRPTPMALQPLRITLQSYAARSGDAGVEWLKDLMRAAAKRPHIGYTNI
jgi:DNA-binding transcriptional LysR family regulator